MLLGNLLAFIVEMPTQAHTNWGWFSMLFPLRSVNRGVLERQMLLFLKQRPYSLNLGSELAAEASSKETLLVWRTLSWCLADRDVPLAVCRTAGIR